MTRRMLSALAVALLVGVACTSSPPDSPEPRVDETAGPASRSLPGMADGAFSRVHEMADGVYLYEQLAGPDEVVTTVSMFVVTSGGVLVADGQGSPADTQRLIDEIAKITDEPITHVVICSDHGDHTRGNVAFPAEAVFYAHPTSAATLEARANQPDQPADAPPIIMPSALVDERLVLQLGGKEIQILFLGRAHTGGDLVVYLPAEEVLFMGETFFSDMFPAMGTAYPTEWVAMIERAEVMDVDMYVPGHAVVGSAEILGGAQLTIHRHAVEQIIAEVRRLHGAGITADEAVEQASFGDLEGWVDRSLQGGRAVRRVYMELDGELPG